MEIGALTRERRGPVAPASKWPPSFDSNKSAAPFAAAVWQVAARVALGAVVLQPVARAGEVAPAPTHRDGGFILDVLSVALGLVVAVIAAYAVRHLVFTVSRLCGHQRQPYLDVDTADWPQITVLIAAHNEEAVVAGCMRALVESNYPADRLKIVPVNDRSQDGTRKIIDDFAAEHPGRIHPFHRTSGKPGKSAAMKDALAFAVGDILLIFDADYVPSRGLLRQLVAPFFDPEVGAVMGRVVPVNTESNLLTRLLDLERSAGYQVDQQARMNLRLVPQYGGTVGGVRRSAVEASGGWSDDALAEDTDITFRLLVNGWRTIYTNRSECYEEVPEEWSVRLRQVGRWAKGHDQVLARQWANLLRSRSVSVGERLDGLLLLGIFVLPPLLMLGWVLAFCLYFLGAAHLAMLFVPAFAVTAFGTLGNFATFFQLVVAVLMDGNNRRLRLLPFNMLCFLVSMVAISRALVDVVLDRFLRRELVWHKTVRYRPVQASPTGGVAP